jgi:hypothetical protein
MHQGSALPRAYRSEDRCRCLASPRRSWAHGMATIPRSGCRLGQPHRVLPVPSSASQLLVSIVRLLGRYMTRFSSILLLGGSSLCRPSQSGSDRHHPSDTDPLFVHDGGDPKTITHRRSTLRMDLVVAYESMSSITLLHAAWRNPFGIMACTAGSGGKHVAFRSRYPLQQSVRQH